MKHELNKFLNYIEKEHITLLEYNFTSAKATYLNYDNNIYFSITNLNKLTNEEIILLLSKLLYIAIQDNKLKTLPAWLFTSFRKYNLIKGGGAHRKHYKISNFFASYHNRRYKEWKN